LRSREADIDVFAACKQRRGRKRSRGIQGKNTCPMPNSRFDPKRLLA
jgi:hypothetical protein